VKAYVDREKCISCGVCESLCPDVFELDEESISVVIVDEIPKDSESCTIDAQEQCPTEAITVD